MSSLGRTLSTPGLNRGGSLGRSPTTHMGLGGTRSGGTNTRGSTKKSFDPGFFSDPLSSTGFSFFNKQGNVAFGVPGVEGAKMIANPFKAGLAKRTADVRPTARPKKGFRWEFLNGRWVQRPVNNAPATPSPAPAGRQPIANLDQLLAAFPNLQNAFLEQESDLMTQRDVAMNSLAAQLAGLTTPQLDPTTGQMITPFEAQMKEFQRQEREQLRREAFDAAQAGLLNSGFRDIQARDLQNELAQQQLGISLSVGKQAQDALRQQIEQETLNFLSQRFGLLRGLRGQVSQDRAQEFQTVLDQLQAQRDAQQQTFNEVFGLGGA